MVHPIVELEQVQKDYPLGRQIVHALHGVSLKVDAGAFVALAGPSGSGKTTLLNLVGLLDTPTAGVVRLEGQDVGALPERTKTRLRLAKLGFVFQSFNLVSVLSAAQNVEVPLLLAGELSAKARRARVDALLDAVGLSEQRHQRPAQLSGGQRQRVAVARALANRPALVLADEPTANLDGETGLKIVELMRALNRSEGTTFLFSTHDPRILAATERAIELVDGRLKAGSP